MGWKADAREYKQKKYGYYCNKCRELGLEIVPYCRFEIEMLEKIKK